MEPLQVAERCVVTNAEALIVDTTDLIYSLFDELRAAGREIVSPVFCMNDDTGSDEHIIVHACVHVESPTWHGVPAVSISKCKAWSRSSRLWARRRPNTRPTARRLISRKWPAIVRMVFILERPNTRTSSRAGCSTI